MLLFTLCCQIFKNQQEEVFSTVGVRFVRVLTHVQYMLFTDASTPSAENTFALDAEQSLECKQVCSSASVCAGSATITQHIYRARSPLLRGCESGVIGCPATVLVKLPICSNGSHISTPESRITHRSPENYSCKLVFVRPAQFWVEAEVISVLFANCPIPRHCYELGQNFNHFTAFNVTLK